MAETFHQLGNDATAANNFTLRANGDGTLSLGKGTAASFTELMKVNSDGSVTTVGAALNGAIYGLTLSNNAIDATNDIDIAVGEAASGQSTPVLMKLTSALTKRLGANWAAGTNQGMRNSAAAITDTTYHLFLVSKAGGADPDIYAHATTTNVATAVTALQAESGGADYIHARRIGSIIRESSANVVFSQHGNFFSRTSKLDVNGPSSLGTSRITQAVSVPTGINVLASLSASLVIGSSPGAETGMNFSDLAVTAVAPSANAHDDLVIASTGRVSVTRMVKTNTAAQIGYQLNNSSASIFVYVSCNGWMDLTR